MSGRYFAAVAVLSVLLAVTVFPTSIKAIEIVKKEDITDRTEKISVEEFLTGKKNEDTDTELFGAFDSFKESLPDDVRSLLDNKDITAIENAAEDFDMEFFWQLLKDCFTQVIGLSLKDLPVLLSLLLISYVAKVMLTRSHGRLREVFALVSASVLALTVLRSGFFDVEYLSGRMTLIKDVSIASETLTVALLTASGRVGEAAVVSSSVGLVCALVEFVFSTVVMPLIGASCAFAAIGSATDDGITLSLSDASEKAASFLTVAIMTVCGFAVSVQSLIARSADSVGIKTVKFAVGSFIPIAGGVLSEAVGTVYGGLSYLGAVAGVFSVIAVIAVCLPPFLYACLSKFVLFILSAFASVIGCESEGRLLRRLSGIMNSFIALSASVAVIFTVLIWSVASTFSAGV